jgi:MFS family permease
VLFTAGLLFWSGLASLLPILPLYIEDAGASSQEIGVVMGCFALGLLLSRSWLAKLTDQRGRKVVLLIGMGAIALAPLGYLVTQALPLLMLFRALHGISIAAFALAYSALVVDLSPPHQRGELIGYMSLVNPLGMAIGPALGGFLQEGMGYSSVFLMSAGMGMIGLLCTHYVEEPRSPHSSSSPPLPNAAFPSAAISANAAPSIFSPPAKYAFWSLLFEPRIRIPALVLLLIGLAFGTLSTFVPLYMQELQLDLNIGLFYTAAAIASFSIRLIAGRSSDRYGRAPFITISLILYSVSMGLLWIARTDVVFILAAIAQGCGSGMLIPMIAALMADRSRGEERGRIFGVCMVGFDIGIALAGPMLGAIADQIHFSNLFGLCTVMTFGGLVLFMTCSSKDLPHSLRFSLGRERDIYAVE